VNIRYTQDLKDYMAKKGYSHIELGIIDASTCCSGFSELVSNFLTDAQASELRERAVRVLNGEVGDIIVTARGLEYEDDIELGLKSFLGAKDITIKGIKAWTFSARKDCDSSDAKADGAAEQASAEQPAQA